MATMSRSNENGIALATPPAIHVGPIVNPITNETISIVIPLSAQLATVTNQKVDKSCKDCTKDAKQSSASRLRNDKTKGCPYPGCTRYGRAFSRAHDLKRHIARHEMRKEKLSDYENSAAGKQQLVGNEIVGNVANRSTDGPQVAWTDDSREAMGKFYCCPHCTKKYTSENKLFAHMNSHGKVTGKNVCAICGTSSKDGEELQMHLRQHTVHLLETQSALSKGEPKKEQPDKEDDFLLEEMLLLNKNPRRKPEKNGNGASKIRCDYCSKTFKTKWTLSSHVAAHEGRFQFDCGQCGKKFVRKSHYEGHVRSHEAARPYVCEQCGKTFKELKHRREHTKKKHSTNQSAIQTLLDSISPYASDDLPVDQTKFTLVIPENFSV
ncbi:zinc finger protein 135-like [Hylaeus anthracinus]|uniref:zinc finger protein 135-like n=1 Tax=Hylaeus volcanicus TaxID=313075 RepID=UPI0023B855A0|nr:zinc finger protein 135-like [Hylaeus volcanicus]XP_053984649.1 zinc finger protein 135-like [Hylaeus volcanicus]XP_053984650.1 zinc finger protein 135-like [Hylaeus volcanicus]XP_054000861.1 zinc finger protein 135-like [Hylaeus anthracinus]XP_054000870.1 zinc finger protein 135-like [Hylaeus anthracinus]XP_054000880.1 zinc finger protein 135-like [Hylaeus anthracinus]